MGLSESIEEHIKSSLWPSLQAFLGHLCSNFGSLDVSIHMALSPRLDAYAEEESTTITISFGWLQRLCLAFELIERMWTSIDSRPKVMGMNIQNAWDSYYFYKPEVSFSHIFLGVPELEAIFLDELPIDDHTEQLRMLPENFARNKGGGPSVLEFDLHNELSQETIKKVSIAAKFLVAHEFSHFSNNHFAFVSDPVEADDLFLQYMRKAIEVDADAEALALVIDAEFLSEELDVSAMLQRIVRSVFICLSMMDLGNRSLHKNEVPGSTHPYPDIRAMCSIALAADYFSRTCPEISSLLKGVQDDAILWSVQSLQNLGLTAGAFYIFANRFWTIDNQFSAELCILILLQEELIKIEGAWNILKQKPPKAPSKWSPNCPFMRSEDECRNIAIETVKNMLDNRNQAPEEAAEINKAAYVESLKKVKAQLGEGGHLLLCNDLEMTSPFITIQNDQSSTEGCRPEDLAKAERIVLTCLSMLFKLAEVKIAPSS